MRVGAPAKVCSPGEGSGQFMALIRSDSPPCPFSEDQGTDRPGTQPGKGLRRDEKEQDFPETLVGNLRGVCTESNHSSGELTE